MRVRLAVLWTLALAVGLRATPPLRRYARAGSDGIDGTDRRAPVAEVAQK